MLSVLVTNSKHDNCNQIDNTKRDKDVYKRQVLELRVAPEDMGKVIGRQGRIAKEIRTLIRSVAQRTGQRVCVEIVD